MSNPNNAFGTNAAFGGRTSPNAFNDVMGAFQSRGILSGWACSPDSGMSVVFGGDGTTRDVAIAEDNSGNKLSVNNIPGTPISVTIAAAPATQTRIDAVIAYIENPPQGTSTATDNYGAVNVLDVQGTASGSPVAPDDNAIRTAITADGASGSTAYYVILAYITVASGTTDITSNLIEAGPSASLQNTLSIGVDSVYPIGSIYMSVNNVSPASFIGGVWQQIKDTFLLAAGDTYTAGSTGGEATHTLTVSEMPSHKHSIPYVYGSIGGGGSWITDAGATGNYNPNATGATGGGQAHNNMPPYLTVYMWQRTA